MWEWGGKQGGKDHLHVLEWVNFRCVNSEKLRRWNTEAKLRCQKLGREVWVRDDNLRGVSVGQEGIARRREARRAEKRAEEGPGGPWDPLLEVG